MLLLQHQFYTKNKLVQYILTSCNIVVPFAGRWRRGRGVQVEQRHGLIAIAPVPQGDAASTAARVRRVGSFQQGPKYHHILVLHLLLVDVTCHNARYKKYQKDHKGTGTEWDVASILTTHCILCK